MSVFEQSPATVETAPNPRPTIASLFLRKVRNATRHWQRNRAIRELYRLSDGQLNDLGISRRSIPGIVDGMFDREETEAATAPTAPQASPSTPEERMRLAA